MNKPNPAPKKVKIEKNIEDPRVAELTLALQRERADTVNIRRQQEEQMKSLRSVVTGTIVQEFLPVMDNFERSLKHVPENLKTNDYIKGIEGIVKQFEKVLSDIGVGRIKTVGEIFDPKFHEAVSMDEGDGMREVIFEELQAGYVLGDQVIRHAMVKVRMEK
jgi:molecular chaperone GrpE